MPYHGLHEGLACLLGTQDLIHLHVLVLVLLVVLKESAGSTAPMSEPCVQLDTSPLMNHGLQYAII